MLRLMIHGNSPLPYSTTHSHARIGEDNANPALYADSIRWTVR